MPDLASINLQQIFYDTALVLSWRSILMDKFAAYFHRGNFFIDAESWTNSSHFDNTNMLFLLLFFFPASVCMIDTAGERSSTCSCRKYFGRRFE